jgi:hypothetical protein
MSTSIVDDGSTHRPLRRLARELIALVAVKLALLGLAGWLVATAWPHADTRAPAIEHHLAPAASSHGDAKP